MKLLHLRNKHIRQPYQCDHWQGHCSQCGSDYVESNDEVGTDYTLGYSVYGPTFSGKFPTCAMRDCINPDCLKEGGVMLSPIKGRESYVV